MSATWRVQVDPRRCIGSGVCTGAAPKHFVLVNGLSSPVAELITPDDGVTDAADSCPVEAITVRDTADDRLIAPEY